MQFKHLLQETMTPENLKKIKTPFMAAYYFKDEENHDKIISIDAIKEFRNVSTTSEKNKRLVALANVNTHVIPSSLYSKDMDSVLNETFNFAEEVLGLKNKLMLDNSIETNNKSE